MAFKTIPLKSLSGNQRLENRFMKYVDKAEDGCWNWTGAKGENIDGTFRAQFNCCGTKSASRMAYALFKGDVPRKMLVLHSCDNGMCVAPEHSRLGTHKENTEEMVAKGRGNTGRKYPGRGTGCKRAFGGRVQKLTDNDVRAIRDDLANGMPQSKIAKRYGVSESHVSGIKNGKRKAHIK